MVGQRGALGNVAVWLRWKAPLALLVIVTVFMSLLSPGIPYARAAVPPLRDRTDGVVTTDALPTVQIDGVVWAQVIVGNVVYVGGEFNAARPAGADIGTSETPRKNLLAYDITTGELIPGFAPLPFLGPVMKGRALAGAVKALAVSPDKKTLYVGGDFTKVGKHKRMRFAALATSNGALRRANPSFNASVETLAANSKTVYVGGSFTSVNGKARGRLAAIVPSSGKLGRWRPKASSVVQAMVLTARSRLLVVGGRFAKLNSTTASGTGAINPTTGKVMTWKINRIVKNGTKRSGIKSLATDGENVYGAAYTYGTGNFEGVFAASSKDGTLRWLQDCHGDTNGVAPIGDVVYSVGHAHYCSNIGGFPDTKPRAAWYRALAVSKKAAGTVAKNRQTSSKAYTNFEGRPAPALLNWFPSLDPGRYTQAREAAWSVVGNRSYISLGGEFPKVNSRPQQGLVRMAVSSLAPNKVGPGGRWPLDLKVNERPDGGVEASWFQQWDRDDLSLTYELIRNGVVIYSQKTSVPFWKRTTMNFVDVDAKSICSPLKYQVKVFDSSGNMVASPGVRVDVTSPSCQVSPTATPTASEQSMSRIGAAGVSSHAP